MSSMNFVKKKKGAKKPVKKLTAKHAAMFGPAKMAKKPGKSSLKMTPPGMDVESAAEDKHDEDEDY